jgi:exopolysaccharide production protein ExoZ
MGLWGDRHVHPGRRVPPSGVTGPPTAPADGKARLRNIQGLRGAAGLIVVIAHVSGTNGFEQRVFGTRWTSWSNLPANTAVDMFFVISGLTMVVTTWRTFDGPGSSRRFLLRRIARIYPLYCVVNTALVMLLVVSPNNVSFDHEGRRPSILQSYLLLPQQGRLPVLVAWSLVYEMYLYAVFGIALMLGRSRFPRVLCVWVVLTLTMSVVSSDATNPYVALVAIPMSLEFVLGVVIGLAVVHARLVQPGGALAAATLSYGGCLVFLTFCGWTEFPSEAVRVALVAIPAGLVVYSAICLEVRHGRVLPSFVQRVGDASYSLFLTHVPALTLLALLLAGRLPTTPWVHTLTLPAVLLVVVCVALGCHRLLERPLQRVAQQLLRPLLRPAPRSVSSETPEVAVVERRARS